MTKVIAPGGRLGVLGSGQLGRMFALAARRMGYRVAVYSPEQDSPAGQVADTEFTGRYEDLERVKAFARGVQAVTFEFENVPFATAAACAEFVPVRPKGEVLHVTQQRLREKTFLAERGFPVTPFARVTSAAELDAALAKLGAPAVLKSADFGYDGKGQAKIKRNEDGAAAWAALGVREAILEAFVDFRLEVSVVAARGLDGSFAHFGVLENAHANHILDITVAPARIEPKVTAAAIELARGIVEALDVVGVLCVELFVTNDGRLLVNELAPRPHNSGHLTVDACLTDQFEQQVRAVCGLPLGATDLLRPAAMANLLGDAWNHGEPRWTKALALPNVKLHLYGKTEPRPGRKMGHLTALADTPDEAERVVREARALLSGA